MAPGPTPGVALVTVATNRGPPSAPPSEEKWWLPPPITPSTGDPFFELLLCGGQERTGEQLRGRKI